MIHTHLRLAPYLHQHIRLQTASSRHTLSRRTLPTNRLYNTQLIVTHRCNLPRHRNLHITLTHLSPPSLMLQLARLIHMLQLAVHLMYRRLQKLHHQPPARHLQLPPPTGPKLPTHMTHHYLHLERPNERYRLPVLLVLLLRLLGSRHILYTMHLPSHHHLRSPLSMHHIRLLRMPVNTMGIIRAPIALLPTPKMQTHGTAQIINICLLEMHLTGRL